jgi:DNA-binding MarR family transcriptional regulator
MPESAHTQAINEAEEQYREILEDATTQMIRTMPRLFRNVKHQLRTENDGIHRELGDQQVWVLLALARSHQLTTELARQFMVTEPTITRMVDALVRKGYVERQPDEKDRRKIYLQLTPVGRQVSDESHGQFRLALSNMLAPLSDEQLSDIIVACGHVSTLMPEGLYDYESACPVRPVALQSLEENPPDAQAILQEASINGK